jgi:hypothetical protein
VSAFYLKPRARHSSPIFVGLAVAYVVGPAVLCAAFSAFGFWQWQARAVPAESELVSVAGEVSETQKTSFKIVGIETEFWYQSYWPHAADLRREIQPGRWIRVKYVPLESRSEKSAIAWEIESKQKYLLRLWETSREEKGQARAGLLLGVGFLATALTYSGIMLWQYFTYIKERS